MSRQHIKELAVKRMYEGNRLSADRIKKAYELLIPRSTRVINREDNQSVQSRSPDQEKIG